MKIRRIAVTVGACLGLMSTGTLAAQDASPVPGPAALPEGCTVVADGLINPRFVAVADDGTIYVTESGIGGDETISVPAEPGATPAAEGPEAGGIARGTTGQVTMIAPDGTQSVLASGLPSYLMGGVESTGPAGIAVAPDGSVIVAVGGSGPGAAMLDALPNENAVLSIDPATGEVTSLADIGAYERASNPEPTDIDSNLYGVAVADDGTIYVNDAGGNATYRIPAGGGELEVLAVHPELPIPEGLEAPPGVTGLDPVPTGIVASEGSVLVGYLSGGPFPPGAAKIVSVSTADGSISDVAGGLTMVVGLTTGPDGHLYASEISTNFLGEMPAPGEVVRVLQDGTLEPVLQGLMLPNGIAFDADGNMLVVVNTVAMGPPNGQLLSCEGIAASASSAPAGLEVSIALRDVRF